MSFPTQQWVRVSLADPACGYQHPLRPLAPLFPRCRLKGAGMVSRSAQRHPRLTLIPLITRLSMLSRREVFALDRHPQLWGVMLEVAIPRECPSCHPKPAEALREAVTQHLPLGESFCFFTLNVLLYSQLGINWSQVSFFSGTQI